MARVFDLAILRLFGSRGAQGAAERAGKPLKLGKSITYGSLHRLVNIWYAGGMSMSMTKATQLDRRDVK